MYFKAKGIDKYNKYIENSMLSDKFSKQKKIVSGNNSYVELHDK